MRSLFLPPRPPSSSRLEDDAIRGSRNSATITRGPVFLCRRCPRRVVYGGPWSDRRLPRQSAEDAARTLARNGMRVTYAVRSADARSTEHSAARREQVGAMPDHNLLREPDLADRRSAARPVPASAVRARHAAHDGAASVRLRARLDEEQGAGRTHGGARAARSRARPWTCG